MRLYLVKSRAALEPFFHYLLLRKAVCLGLAKIITKPALLVTLVIKFQELLQCTVKWSLPCCSLTRIEAPPCPLLVEYPQQQCEQHPDTLLRTAEAESHRRMHETCNATARTAAAVAKRTPRSGAAN